MILQHNVKYLLYRCCKTWVSMIRSNYRTKKWLQNERTELIFTQIYNIYQMDQIWQNACVLWIRQLTWNKISRVLTIVEKYNLTKMLEMHQNLRKLRKNVISKKSSVLKGSTTLNPSTFGGMLDNYSPSKQRRFWDVLVLSGTFKS